VKIAAYEGANLAFFAAIFCYFILAYFFLKVLMLNFTRSYAAITAPK